MRMVIGLRNGVLAAIARSSLDELSRFRKAIMIMGATSVRANASSLSVYS